jgi:predicted membrane chloride channel (bestrophin family)
MPFGYLAQQRIFIILWLLTYPFAMTYAYGWFTLPVSAFISFIM